MIGTRFIPSLRHLLSWFLALSGFLISVLHAQTDTGYIPLLTAQSQTVADTVSGLNLNASLVSPLPKHGNVQITMLQSGGTGVPYIYRIAYTPDAGFVGLDTFTLELNYIGNYPYLTYRAYKVTVHPSLLTARPDFATTPLNQPALVDVKANDAASALPLTLSVVSLADHGTASITTDQKILFVPNAGFSGIAHFNYTVCDALNFCQTAPVSIGVHLPTPPPHDTLRVATERNERLSIPLPNTNYSIFKAPSNGTLLLEQNGQVFRYTPNLNFTGFDNFILSNSTYSPVSYKTVLVHVLNSTTPNTMAQPDLVYTPAGQPITFNVRANDIGGLHVKSWVAPPAALGTISNMSSLGNVTFTPAAGVTGPVTFSYNIGNQFIPALEQAAVTVVINNQYPSADSFSLTTPVGTPLVLEYPVPFTSFGFTITNQPGHGELIYYPGFSTQTYNGETVQGHNLLKYTPDNGYIGQDEFEISYCVQPSNQCKTVKIGMDVVQPASSGPYCFGGCVWTGDVNNDGVVNNKDLLPLGYLMGLKGPVRPNASSDWFPQGAPNWENPFINLGLDEKFADTDGNGAISISDTSAILQAYGKNHQLTPAIAPVTKGLPFAFKLLTPNPAVGDLVRVEVSLGTPANPVRNLYGFTFDISLSPQIVDSALQMHFSPNTWLNLNAPYAALSVNPRPGRLETALTRTNGLTTDGYGKVGIFDYVVIDIIEGAKLLDPKPFVMAIGSGSAIWGNGQITYSEPVVLEIPINTQPRHSEKHMPDNRDFFVYPSPATDRIQLHLNGPDRLEALEVFDATGNRVFFQEGVQNKHAELQVSSWNSGAYIVRARTAKGMVAKAFQVIH